MMRNLYFLKKIAVALLVTAGLFVAQNAAAQVTFSHNGIDYEVVSEKTAKIIGQSLPNTMTSLAIASVKEGGKTYSITGIEAKAFKDCDFLHSVVFPNVTAIGDSAFANCAALQKAHFLNIAEIGNAAFFQCVSLSEFMIGTAIPKFGKDVFAALFTAESGAIEKGLIAGGKLYTTTPAIFGEDYEAVAVEGVWKVTPCYTITVQSKGKGTISADAAVAIPGTNIKLTISPETGEELKSLVIKETIAPYRIIVSQNDMFEMPDANILIEAVFSGTDAPIVTPTIQRKVTINDMEGVSVDKNLGEHYVESGGNFELTITPIEGYAFHGQPVITTGDLELDKKVTYSKAGNGYKITIPKVQKEVTISLKDGVSRVSNEQLEGNKIWTSGNTLYIQNMEPASTLQIYNIAGQIVRSTAIGIGQTTISDLGRGLYIVKVAALTQKIVIK